MSISDLNMAISAIDLSLAGAQERHAAAWPKSIIYPGVDEERRHVMARVHRLATLLPVDLLAADVNSFANAFVDAASMGLTFNPLRKFVGLALDTAGAVPVAKLFPTYLGVKAYAISVGAIKSATAALVYDGDEFQWRGPRMTPLHNYDPFGSSRGALRGAYCEAVMPDNSVLVSPVKREVLWEFYMMGSSTAGSPWDSVWHEQMLLAKVIHQASKEWNLQPTAEPLSLMTGVA